MTSNRLQFSRPIVQLVLPAYAIAYLLSVAFPPIGFAVALLAIGLARQSTSLSKWIWLLLGLLAAISLLWTVGYVGALFQPGGIPSHIPTAPLGS